MAEPYRFGGPIPERAKQLMDRRRFRGSESFANLKRLRGDRFDEERASKQPFVPRSPEHAAAAAALQPFEGRPFLDAGTEARMPVSRPKR